MGKVTITFEPNTAAPVDYMVYGISASGTRVPVSSGTVSGTVAIPVSGFDNYTMSAWTRELTADQVISADSTVTLAFGTEVEFQTVLWQIFQYIGVIWGNSAESGLEQFQFQRAVTWQVELDPNYATYYAEAVAEYTRLLQETGSVDTAMRTLFAENQADDPKLPDVAQYVLKEFLTWQIAYGGFRAFGPPYQNYTGWMGGGSFNDVPPPYRAISNE